MADPTLPTLLAWSPDRPYTGRTTDWNAGCPAGYFAEFVGAGDALATPLPNGVEGVRCRLVTQDAAMLATESYSWEDTLANLNAALLEAGGGEISPLWWLVFGLIGIGVWEQMARPAIARAKARRAAHRGR